jgi:hypothetical protein
MLCSAILRVGSYIQEARESSITRSSEDGRDAPEEGFDAKYTYMDNSAAHGSTNRVLRP